MSKLVSSGLTNTAIALSTTDYSYPRLKEVGDLGGAMPTAVNYAPFTIHVFII
ncbi:hypothetical protein [Nostoc sp. FACHB-133]|uniref:hypothetical protein n=1 Tax=Nostoc sp. FACHB-133 TaxID=2692835 RepID=UPI00168425FB|nr:hypothetical protein [Nostoc sp. FACHB-133]MBD2526356.1 hypothetical protein [Nostoc sp. FACHB-133]